MNVFNLRNHLIKEYSDYISSFINIRDERIRAYVDQQLADGLLWPDPLIQPNPFIQRLIDDFHTLQPHLEMVATERAEALLQSPQRVRDAARHRGRYRVEPKLPPDILGIYIYLPKG